MKKETVILFFVFFAVLFSFSQGIQQAPEQEKLKYAVLVEDHDFIYGLNIFPSDKIEGLFHWEVVMKNFKTGEIIALFRANTMRGQENIFERMLHPDGSKIIITTSIEINKSRIIYRIQRSKKKQLIFSHEGDKEILF